MWFNFQWTPFVILNKSNIWAKIQSKIKKSEETNGKAGPRKVDYDQGCTWAEASLELWFSLHLGPGSFHDHAVSSVYMFVCVVKKRGNVF